MLRLVPWEFLSGKGAISRVGREAGLPPFPIRSASGLADPMSVFTLIQDLRPNSSGRALPSQRPTRVTRSGINRICPRAASGYRPSCLAARLPQSVAKPNDQTSQWVSTIPTSQGLGQVAPESYAIILVESLRRDVGWVAIGTLVVGAPDCQARFNECAETPKAVEVTALPF